MSSTLEQEIRSLYQDLIEGWNERSADTMAGTFTEDGEMIGFDGSQVKGKDEIISHLQPIFAQYPTPPFVSKVKDVRPLGSEAAILRAIVGMVPPGQSDISPDHNAHQTLVAVKKEGNWRVALFQNTPAQFHGRPELVEQMTEELRQLL